jgi:hypothetical protein
MRHRALMLGAAPKLCLGLVATGAGLATDECYFSTGNRSRGRFLERTKAELNE